MKNENVRQKTKVLSINQNESIICWEEIIIFQNEYYISKYCVSKKVLY